ncbi:hypothetical protein QYM36_004644 [Artemia franciscana]|uniref:hydroxymethylbilane synthase n=1 Tax=Artemia franciscana TaxID=6661 RepID=A0AA88I5X8_ARTSF|nr:hypothetical protein QYM36_004644 [Artemia franciscana]
MTQTEFVVGLLQKQELSVAFKIVPMSTVGDHILDQPLSQIGEKSLFTKELEVALEKKEVDFVVHSSKDLPTTLPDGMVIAAILEREDPRDSVIVSSRHSFKSISELPPASVVDPSVCMYAIGQGALAIECREGDKETIELLSHLYHAETALRCVAERSFLRTLEGGCSVPVAVCSSLDNQVLQLEGGVWSLDGAESITGESSVELPTLQGNFCDINSVFVGVVSSIINPECMKLAEKLGAGLAQNLIQKGAMDILRKARADTDLKKNAVTTNLCAIHTKRVTIMPKDIQPIRGERA